MHGEKLGEENSLPRLFTKELLEESTPNLDDVEKHEFMKKKLDYLANGIPVIEEDDQYAPTQFIYNLFVSECFNCHKVSVWIHDKLVYPLTSTAPSANPDLPADIRDDYNEASSILDLSPRGAAALLRLAIQKICKELGQSGENINADISALVAEGLSRQIQQALDVVRVIGNNAVHPGQIDLRDDKTIAHSLFMMVNLIADRMISEPKRIEEAYAALPERDREAIARRDDLNP